MLRMLPGWGTNDNKRMPFIIQGDLQMLLAGELAQLARAPALQAGGQGFDSLILHQGWK